MLRDALQEENPMSTQHYAMVIEWSDEDAAYLVSFPE
jgi:hypothetical protein